MSSVADVKAALNAANSMVTEGQELLHAAQQKLDDAMSAYMAALDSASQDTIYNIGGPLDAMKEHVADALQSGETVKEASQTYANAL